MIRVRDNWKTDTEYKIALCNKGRRIDFRWLRAKDRRDPRQRNAGEKREGRHSKTEQGCDTQWKEVAVRRSLWPASRLIKQG